MKNKLTVRVFISLINLLLVASLGVIMRYKIGFECTFFDQTNLQHAHSHFAFYGWVTHTLMSLMIAFLEREHPSLSIRKYDRFVKANLLISYAMLFSFALWGYNVMSIVISIFAMLISFLFTYSFIRDSKQCTTSKTAIMWFQASLVFNTIASLGTLALAYMMVTSCLPQHLYLSSVYFYLHFQYNGWFFFSCMGLLHLFFQSINIKLKHDKKIFIMFALSCIPAYFLSVLWINLPTWLYLIVVAASLLQFVAWIIMYRSLLKHSIILKSKLSPLVRWLFIVLSIALTIKLILQLGSVIPLVSNLAFGFRPVVIAYLHLVLLAIISIFLIAYLMSQQLINTQKMSIIGAVILVSAIYSTEIVLAIQGIASFSYTIIPFINEILFVLACCMFSGILVLLLAQYLFPKHD